MAKVTTISYIIVAVCIFQIAEADLPGNPLTSLLNNVQEQFTDTFQNIKTLGDGIQNRGKDLIKLSQKKDIEISQKILQSVNTSACTKVYNEGQAIITEIISILDSCIMNETQSVSGDIQKLTNVVNNLYANLTKNFQDVLQCFQNPFNIIPCLITVTQNASELVPMFEQVVSAALDLAQFFPNVRMCYKTAYLQSSQQNFRELVKDAGLCFESVFQRFI